MQAGPLNKKGAGISADISSPLMSDGRNNNQNSGFLSHGNNTMYPDETIKTAQGADQKTIQPYNQSPSQRKTMKAPKKSQKLMQESPRLPSSSHRRRKKEGFLKEFSYNKNNKEELGLDDLLVKMEDSVNYDDFKIALQNAPKGGV